MASRLDDSYFQLIFGQARARTERRAAITALSIEDALKSLYDGGMSKDEILTFIFDTPTGRAQFIDPISNAFGDTVATNLQQIRHNTRDVVYGQNLPENQLYRWQLVKVKNCEDCIARSLEEPKTMAEWELVGLPQAGATICDKYCGCELEPVKV